MARLPGSWRLSLSAFPNSGNPTRLHQPEAVSGGLVDQSSQAQLPSALLSILRSDLIHRPGDGILLGRAWCGAHPNPLFPLCYVVTVARGAALLGTKLV